MVGQVEALEHDVPKPGLPGPHLESLTLPLYLHMQRFIAADFFQPLPSALVSDGGLDAALFKFILHDWSDQVWGSSVELRLHCGEL
jgi:hypothetical protein